MWVVRAVVMMLAVGALSGCAGARMRQEFARMQSQVGMLDERITQLERSGTTGFSGAPAVDASGMEGGLTMESASPNVASASAPAAASSGKPATREIQQALKNAGFYQGAIDGKMGPMTRTAVKEFQRVHGLNDDGLVGKLTWAKLRPYVDLSAGGGEAAVEALK